MAKTEHNGHGAEHVTEIPDVSYIKNVDVTHETSDVSVSALLKFVGALTLMTIVVSVLMWGLFKLFQSQEEKKEPKPGPMAMTKDERLPPEPRLQAAPGFGVKREDGQWVNLQTREPEAEFRVLREQWEQRLNCGTEKRTPQNTMLERSSAGCMPIDEAIQRLVETGLPSRTQENQTKPPILAMPTAASSGRTP
jgi:hypothetical protein